MHYKDLQNNLHFIDDDRFAYLLPEGSVQITDEEAEALRPVFVQPIPSVLTMRQARLALLQAGKLQAVTDAINSLKSPQKEAAQIEWEYAQEVQRNNGFVSLLAPALGMDDAALDELFTAGSEL